MSERAAGAAALELPAERAEVARPAAKLPDRTPAEATLELRAEGAAVARSAADLPDRSAAAGLDIAQDAALGSARDSVLDAEVARIRAAYLARDAREQTQPGPWSARNPHAVVACAIRDLALVEAVNAAAIDLAAARVLDAGCGDGGVLALLGRLGARPERCAGLDLMPGRAAAARRREPAAGVVVGDLRRTGFRDASFDVVVVVQVMSSMLAPGLRRAAAAEIDRVLAPSGVLVWQDLKDRQPPGTHVQGVPRAELEALFPRLAVTHAAVSAHRWLARLGARTPRLALALEALPLLPRTVLTAVLRRRP